MTDRVGQDLGHYHLVRLLGEGGFAEVYLGEHLDLGTPAAIKVLTTKLQSDEIDRFRAEARTIARLKHPSIVRVLDFGVAGGVPYLVMDYAAQGTLRHRHPKGSRLAPATILPYVRQVASALQFAHEQKVIHRDVKPENMLLGDQGEVWLSDFGIAVVAQSSRYQNTPDVGGTVAYMAPEQIQAHPRPASDQYSLGVVIYEWLTGERPFVGSMHEVLAKQISVPPQPLREHVPDLSPALEQVVLTALEKDPLARFASLRAFATAFEQVCQEGTPHVVSDRAVTLTDLDLPITEPVTPDRAPVVEVASPVLQEPIEPDRAATLPPEEPSKEELLVSQNPTSPQPESLEVVQIGNRESKATQTDALHQGSAYSELTQQKAPDSTPLPTPNKPALSASVVSRRTVLIAGGSLVGLAALGGGAIWLTHPQGSPDTSVVASPTTPPTLNPTPSPTPTPPSNLLFTYRGHSNAVRCVAWSPDGKRIASGGDDGTVQVWDATNGSNAFIYRDHPSGWGTKGVAWSPDSTRIAYGSKNGTVQVLDASNGSNPYIYRGLSSDVQDIAWSPNGRRIVSGYYEGTVQAWDASNGGNVLNYYFPSFGDRIPYVTSVAWSPNGQRIASGNFGQIVLVLDAASDGSIVFTYHGHSDAVWAVAWLPNGQRIASGSGDGTVQVWDASNGGNVVTYHGHESNVFAVACSPDGARIASASFDTTVQVWDVSDGSNQYTYRGHASYGVFAVAWSPDGKYIASGGNDMTVQVWKAP
jgi:WD40 repeat protein/tRNA A-37 threonylcarbamoyl transferase component Bud32